MKFPHNDGKTGVFAAAFNDIARRAFDMDAFFKTAEANGWAEARIQSPGDTIVLQTSRQHDRITAQLNEDGNLRRYLKG